MKTGAISDDLKQCASQSVCYMVSCSVDVGASVCYMVSSGEQQCAGWGQI